jgi:uncharacterized membrane protein
LLLNDRQDSLAELGSSVSSSAMRSCKPVPSTGLPNFSSCRYHIIIDMFNLLGVAIMVLSAIGTLPMLINHIIPSMIFHKGADKKATSYVLRARMQLGRGIMLGMDFMVTSDVIETLCGEIDIIKLICIVVVRSWLGYERSKEVLYSTCTLSPSRVE